MRTCEQQDVSPQPKRNDGGPVNELKYRFNWNAPIVGSPHDKKTVYFGSNVVFKSTDFGKTWAAISPDLSTNDPEKQKSVGTIWNENTTAEYHCTVIRIAESPVQAGVIWAGHQRWKPAAHHRRRQEVEEPRDERPGRSEVRGDRVDRALPQSGRDGVRGIRAPLGSMTFIPASSRPRTSARLGRRSQATSPKTITFGW